MDSILTSIKGLLNITEECKDFDDELIIFINSALAIVAQLGAGPKDGFAITGDSETWNDFLGKDQRLNLVKSYVHHKVKLRSCVNDLNVCVWNSNMISFQRIRLKKAKTM